MYLGVSNFQRAMSMVLPLSRSAFSLSNTQAYLKDPFPDSWDSFSNFSMVLLSITSALVDQVTSGGGLARVDVADNDNVNVSLFLSHFRSSLRHNSLVEVNQAILSL